jgi:hypothetical protein
MKTITLYSTALLLLLSSCATYTIPIAEFKKMYEGKRPTRTVVTESPFGGRSTYKTYPISYIKCWDKKGKQHELINGPYIEMRVTDTNGRRRVYYFDKVVVNDSVLSGAQSRILGIDGRVPLAAIKKIEVQDGGKKYRHVKVED